METVNHKRGDTLELVATVSDDGSAVDITSYTIRAHLRDTSDVLIFTFTVTKSDPTNGVFSLSATAVQTASWTAGSYLCDIEFTDGSSNIFSTDTFGFNLVVDISHD